MESKRQRIRDLCFRKAITSSLKGYVLRMYFEDRDGRAVTESERKRIPDLCSGEAEGTTTMLFSFQDGDAKSSSGEERIRLLILFTPSKYAFTNTH